MADSTPQYMGPAGAVDSYNKLVSSARPRKADAGRQQNSGGDGVDTKRSDVFNDGYISAKTGVRIRGGPPLDTDSESFYAQEKMDPWQDSDHDKAAAEFDNG